MIGIMETRKSNALATAVIWIAIVVAIVGVYIILNTEQSEPEVIELSEGNILIA